MAFICSCNNFPAGWWNVVETWGDLNGKYFELDNDLPAWYVENSNSALFSAASWKCGYPAICEMDVEKRSYTGERGRPPAYAGRMDLEIHINDQRYWIEAKRRAFALSENSTYSLRHSFLASSMRDAWGDARQCRAAAAGFEATMVAVVFFSGHIDPDAPERQPGRGRIAQRQALVDAEIVHMQEHMNELNADMEGRVHWAVFSQEEFAIERGWQGYLWPAVFGMCAVFDNND